MNSNYKCCDDSFHINVHNSPKFVVQNYIDSDKNFHLLPIALAVNRIHVFTPLVSSPPLEPLGLLDMHFRFAFKFYLFRMLIVDHMSVYSHGLSTFRLVCNSVVSSI